MVLGSRPCQGLLNPALANLPGSGIWNKRFFLRQPSTKKSYSIGSISTVKRSFNPRRLKGLDFDHDHVMARAHGTRPLAVQDWTAFTGKKLNQLNITLKTLVARRKIV
jgi:hypothetical protein